MVWALLSTVILGATSFISFVLHGVHFHHRRRQNENKNNSQNENKGRSCCSLTSRTDDDDNDENDEKKSENVSAHSTDEVEVLINKIRQRSIVDQERDEAFEKEIRDDISSMKHS